MAVELTSEPIDYHSLVESTRNHASGAVVLFLGTVRELSEGRPVSGLDYETYPRMAVAKMEDVVAEARKKWPINDAKVIHRYGHLELGDIAVAVTTASAHRAEAFESARWIMDTIKQCVPIWKREEWADETAGTGDWVHPTVKPTDVTS